MYFKIFFNPYIEGAISTLVALYEQSGAPNYLERAFMYAEKNKATRLAQALKEADARQVGRIPQELLYSEQQLRIDLAFYKKKLYESQEDTKDSLRQRNIRGKIFSLTHEYDSLIMHMEQAYPDYYQLKYQTSIISVADMQKELASDEAVLEYMVGDSMIYAFVIGNESFSVHQIPRAFDLEALIFDLRKAIYKPFVPPSVYASENYGQLKPYT